MGDGDDKSLNDVVAADVYPGYVVEKDECIGHVQKRVGARLRTYKMNYKGINLADHKRLCGVDRLTNKIMNTLQNYYGMVIRSNIGNLYQMKKGIAALLYYCSESLDINDKPDNEARHQYCPRGKDSLCKYHSDKFTEEST